MTAYATSEFGLHSLLTVVDIVSSAMTAACYIPLAKALDIWGRAEGFMLMVSMLTLGMVLQAAAPNLPALCAGRVR
jgi:predicted MFS family arabinose efflux permease